MKQLVKTKQGEIAKCAVCKAVIPDDDFFIITKVRKLIPSFPCPKCGKTITIERDVSKEAIEIKKSCKCDLLLKDTTIEDSNPKWEEKHYPICEKCFKENFSTVLFLELGAD